jgi:hypothetical protein
MHPQRQVAAGAPAIAAMTVVIAMQAVARVRTAILVIAMTVAAASVIVPLTKTADRAWVTRLSVPSATPWNTHSSRSRSWRRRPTVKR